MKEQARLFIAIALSFVVFFVWQALFVEEKAPQAPQPAKDATVTTQQPYVQKETKEITAGAESGKIAPAPRQARKVEGAKPARTIVVDTPLYILRISENGAMFESYVLKAYREQVEKDSPLKELVPQEATSGTLQLGFSQNSLPGANHAVYTSEYPSDSLVVSDTEKTLRFRWHAPNGVVVERAFHFSPNTYYIQHVVTVMNGSDHPIQDSLYLSLYGTVPEKGSRFGFEGPSALIETSVEEIAPKKIAEKNVYSGLLRWIALQDRYFISSIIPKTPVETSMKLALDPNQVLRADYVQPASIIHPGSQQAFEYGLYFGPKSVKTLRSIGYDMDKAVDFGWFDFIAKPCLWLMNYLHDFIPNYGVTIIILTVMIKILLWPLGTKSYKSMNEMKRLQPIMAEIREKYKNDKKKMNEEIMGLYRTYKINPMGGCLPMVAQIPVFFAFYRMLYQAIELRHAPFFGWINDLSAPDRLLRFDFSIPFMEPPYGIPVLTIIMGGTMLLQQKMTPTPGDPSQAKMMMLMPVVFTFIFINFSSGLVLYWLVNNVLSISQQYYITKKLA